ncbi:MAG: hypothetical protein QOF07_1047 [Bradyrhizobium sp.]|jgi:hypothetical protein|nr:hypothetical protein [Bradyrhizobium sp.]
MGIIGSGTIYATDYRYLNDSTEGGEIRKLLLPIFEAETAKVTAKLVDKGLLSADFYKDHGERGHRLQAEGLYRAFATVADRVSPVFVSSFCKHDEGSEIFESGLLSQWRGYASGGGFAIEFDEDGIDTLAKRESEKYAVVGFKTEDVLYDRFERIFGAKDYEGLAGSMIADLFEARDISHITGKRDIDRTMIKFLSVAPFLKNPGFREEREYRMTISNISRGHIPDGEKRAPKEIKYRERAGLVVPYMELFSTVADKLPIKSIIVGPHAHQELQEESIKMMLESKYHEVKVRRSRIPFRQ